MTKGYDGEQKVTDIWGESNVFSSSEPKVDELIKSGGQQLPWLKYL